VSIYTFKDGTLVETGTLPLGSRCRIPLLNKTSEDIAWLFDGFPSSDQILEVEAVLLQCRKRGENYLLAELEADDMSTAPCFRVLSSGSKAEGRKLGSSVYIPYDFLMPPIDYVVSQELLAKQATKLWKSREEYRIRSGIYYALDVSSYGLIPIEGHYLHWTITEGEKLGKVAYTANDAHGIADRQTITKLGKYLKRYYPEVKDHVIRDLVGQMTSVDFDLHLCTSYEDIYRAYHQIDDSCMGVGKVIDNPHPCIVYSDNPDVAVAFIEHTGRAVLNMKQKTFYSIYGDKSRMIPLLDKAGFTMGSTALEGCLLRRVRHEKSGEILMPYLDGTQNLEEVNDEWFRVVDEPTPYQGCSTSGFLSIDEDQAICECCGVTTDEYQYNTDDELICEDCIDTTKHKLVYIGYDQELVDTDYYDVWKYEGNLYTEDGLDYADLIVTEDGVVRSKDDVQLEEAV